MIDIQILRREPEFVREGLAKRGYDFDAEKFQSLDGKRRELIEESETLKAKRNKVSAEIPKLKREGKDISELLETMRGVAERIKGLDEELREAETELNHFMLDLPNLPDDDVPAGGKEANEVIEVHGEKPSFDFEPKHHVDLAVDLGRIDYVRCAKLSGCGFWIFANVGARLEWALLQYFD